MPGGGAGCSFHRAAAGAGGHPGSAPGACVLPRTPDLVSVRRGDREPGREAHRSGGDSLGAARLPFHALCAGELYARSQHRHHAALPDIPRAPPSGLEYGLERPGARMTFVVTENCIKCKYMDCVEVCPVDCFHEGPNFLVIDPDECIDCTLCEPECPAEAIFSEDELPAGQEHFKQLNAELAKQWPVITEKKDPPEDAKEWEGKPDKFKLLER